MKGPRDTGAGRDDVGSVPASVNAPARGMRPRVRRQLEQLRQYAQDTAERGDLVGAALAVLTRLPAWPVWAALALLATEAWRAGWPWGGMPFGRLAFATIDTPLAAAMPWVGAMAIG